MSNKATSPDKGSALRVGLALSGGGVRATVFHLGVLKRLSACPHWRDVAFLSTVSGGSLCAALIFKEAGHKWPDATTFQSKVLPNIKRLLTTTNLERRYKFHLLNPWWWFRGRAKLLAGLLHKHWGIAGSVSQMSDRPRWEIGATCYETGKNWRFSKRRMGDYIANYVVSPDFPLAEAVAASAAVPGMIGPLFLDPMKYEWRKYAKGGGEPTIPADPIASRITLWDGGVYDNLGAEVMFKPQDGLRNDIDFLIVSDASWLIQKETRRLQFGLPPYIPPFRLIDVATDQVRGLRLRSFVKFLTDNPKKGVVLRIGNTVARILKEANSVAPNRWARTELLDESKVETISTMETTLRKLDKDEYDLLSRHGYEVADATLHAYGHVRFGPSADMRIQ